MGMWRSNELDTRTLFLNSLIQSPVFLLISFLCVLVKRSKARSWRSWNIRQIEWNNDNQQLKIFYEWVYRSWEMLVFVVFSYNMINIKCLYATTAKSWMRLFSSIDPILRQFYLSTFKHLTTFTPRTCSSFVTDPFCYLLILN